jgi:exopolysaccharide biosynthesis polyprenyl glycosylphosphotransferase
MFLKCVDFGLLILSLAVAIVATNAFASGIGAAEYSVEFFSSRVTIVNAVLCGTLLFIWHFCLRFSGLYFSNRLSSELEISVRVVRGVGLCSAALLIFAVAAGWLSVRLATVLVFWLLSIGSVVSFRFAVYRLSRHFRRRGINTKSMLLIGGGRRSEKLIRMVNEEPALGYKVLGYLDSGAGFRERQLADAPWLGTLEDLERIINGVVVDEVAVTLPVKSHYSEIVRIIAHLEEQGIVVHLLSDIFPYRLSEVHSHHFHGIPLLSLHSSPRFSWRMELKRLVDITVSASLLVLLSPLLLLIAVLIKLDSKGSVLFSQERMGYNKRRFHMIKFRTMVADAEDRLKEVQHLNEKDGPIFKIKNDPRITGVGRFLRKFSLDELPQLFNVLVGDMSLVGPRPLALREALKLKESLHKRRFSVKPGLTCLWQVSGRSDLSFDEWMELDLEYIDHWSLNLDWKILAQTLPAVITGRGAV